MGLPLLALVLASVWLHPKFIFINFTDSIPRGIYLRVSLGQIRKGDTVAYLPPDGVSTIMLKRGWISKGNTVPFLKYVGGVPGDTFCVYERKFSINGVYVGEVLAADSKGHPLPQYIGTHEVPDREFLPLASNPKGFDGRYTGCVPMERIIARVIPLLVVD